MGLQKKRLAIVGCGSSGLVTLKYALDALPDWNITAFEKSSSMRGCWGQPPAGFISTSTRYTTQFACFPVFDALVRRRGKGGDRYPEFFQNSEFGDYLEQFASRFGLAEHVRLNTEIRTIRKRTSGEWELSFAQGEQSKVHCFDAVVLCTGLADAPKPLESEVPIVEHLDQLGKITGQKVVVIGGGESGVDVAHRLADPQRRNQVWLSVRTGMRVSPRYHPIRGVPSDFLRNRLLLSFDRRLRNRLGQTFVEFRMRSQQVLEKLFPNPARDTRAPNRSQDEIKNAWSLRLTRAARDGLFNMYHNKSDDFLDAVASGRIRIVGGASDKSCRRFYEFGCREVASLDPDWIVPAIGYRSRLEAFSAGTIRLRDFYLGISHIDQEGLFAVGFTRPVIGNIPSISEMQARYVAARLAGKISAPPDIRERHRQNRTELERWFSSLDTAEVYPVEMFPYCDQIAKELGCYRGLRASGSVREYLRMLLSPATTLHYQSTRSFANSAPIHMPALLITLLIACKPLDWACRAWSFLRPAPAANAPHNEHKPDLKQGK